MLFKSATTEGTDTDKGESTHLVHANLTNHILACAYRVHSRLGPGLLERPYKVCLAHELDRLGIRFEQEKFLPLEYDGLTLNMAYRIDLLVDDKVIVEAVAASGATDERP